MNDTQTSKEVKDKILKELKELDKEAVEINGIKLKPSQCYGYSLNPVHVLFNTNCPDWLKEKILSILRKYLKDTIKIE